MKYVYLILIMLLVNTTYGGKLNNKSNLLKKYALNADSTVINIGQLHNYVSNSTREDFQTFMIGREDQKYPSMMWLEGGYENNHYLYNGSFIIGYNFNTIRFSTETSEDFVTQQYHPDIEADMQISFSMTDQFADSIDYVGVKTICTVYAWDDSAHDDIFIYEYSIVNNSGHIMDDIYCGFTMDCDISSVAGGEGSTSWVRDDNVKFYAGSDYHGNPESISYMYDDDNYNIPGNDFGGIFDPKESLGFIGSRVIRCPATKNLIPENQASGHDWWMWGEIPEIGRASYNMMKRGAFRQQLGSPHDYRYLQAMGPWDINAGDTCKVVLALGIGYGLEGLRSNLQNAYDIYSLKSTGPNISYYYPKTDSILTYVGKTIKFGIKSEQGAIYNWYMNDVEMAVYDSVFIINAKEDNMGTNRLMAIVSNNQYVKKKQWFIEVLPPQNYRLSQNYPNPFNDRTVIPFEIAKDGKVKIDVYDVLGRKVNNLTNTFYKSGPNFVNWDGTNNQNKKLASGLYFYMINSRSFTAIKKMVFIK
jgi:type IX secretion system substrate protein